MRNLYKYVLTNVFTSLTFLLATYAQQTKPIVSDSLVLEPYISDTVLLRDFMNKQSVVNVNNDISVKLDLSADLNSRIVSGTYEIKNLTKKDLTFNYTSSMMAYEPRSINIRSSKVKKEEFRNEISVTKIDANTNFTIIRPYLLVNQLKSEDQFLIADHDIEIKITIPEKAKVLKSSIPFIKVQENQLEWGYSGVKVIPPIYLWYTTSEIQIELSKKFEIEQDEAVYVALEIKNTGQTDASNLQITTQFPANLYQPDWDFCDGQFILHQGIMYDWKMKIDNIRTGENRIVKYKLLKDSQIPYTETETIVYSKEGDILAIE